MLPKKVMVAYSEATATIAGTMDCTAANIAIRKLCLYRTGWVIGYPLSHEQCSSLRVVEARQALLSAKYIYACVTYFRKG
jgi:hypothetical protein